MPARIGHKATNKEQNTKWNIQWYLREGEGRKGEQQETLLGLHSLNVKFVDLPSTYQLHGGRYSFCTEVDTVCRLLLFFVTSQTVQFADLPSTYQLHGGRYSFCTEVDTVCRLLLFFVTSQTVQFADLPSTYQLHGGRYSLCTEVDTVCRLLLFFVTSQTVQFADLPSTYQLHGVPAICTKYYCHRYDEAGLNVGLSEEGPRTTLATSVSNVVELFVIPPYYNTKPPLSTGIDPYKKYDRLSTHLIVVVVAVVQYDVPVPERESKGYILKIFYTVRCIVSMSITLPAVQRGVSLHTRGISVHYQLPRGKYLYTISCPGRSIITLPEEYHYTIICPCRIIKDYQYSISCPGGAYLYTISCPGRSIITLSAVQGGISLHHQLLMQDYQCTISCPDRSINALSAVQLGVSLHYQLPMQDHQYTISFPLRNIALYMIDLFLISRNYQRFVNNDGLYVTVPDR
ncbi:hypothetical protein J6590_006455 [Homalodisca vitripennis]|nr:hypothetical protein J6590_006455 [Homalodisca vitripennis]